MPTLRRTAIALASLLVGSFAASLACSHSHDHDHSHGPPGDPCNDGGAYLRLGNFTDEACRSYVDAESRGQVVVDAAKAPKWTNPAASGRVPAAPPPRFTWSAGTLARSYFESILRALDPISTAWAHGDTTGDAYVLHFRDKAGKELLRVMTTNAEYAPDAATWDRLRAGGSLVVTLVGVRFTRNVIASGTKPTAAEALTVEVQ